MADVPAFLHAFAPPARDRAHYVTIVRGEGAAVFDADGRRYIDALGSLWYCQVGHGRREIADAVHRQMTELATFNTFDRATNVPAEELAERLASLAPMPNARVFLTSSGSEAVDSAIKLARVVHRLRGEADRTVVIALEGGYHGTALGGTSLQGIAVNHDGWGGYVSDIVHVPHDDLDAMTAAIGDADERLAAVIAEPVQGAGGVRPLSAGYLATVGDACRTAGGLLVLDEVICGFGRLGTWWGAERHGVVPDLVTFAKGVTSGYLPVGGVLVGETARAALESDPDFVLRHGFTYSGHPTTCAAALANLDLIEAEGLVDRAPVVGARLRAGVQPLVDAGRAHALRGDGAILGVVLADQTAAFAARDRLFERGVILRAIGDTLALCPPLMIPDDDIDLVVEALTGVLAANR